LNKKKIFIAGQEGMVGFAIYNLLKLQNNKKKYYLIDCSRNTLDLTNQLKVNQWFEKNKPDIVINAAGRVGGILDNSMHQLEYIYVNTLIGFNLLKSSLTYNVKKFINLVYACIYPKEAKQPKKEKYLLTSPLEKINEGYGIAKIATLKYTQYIKNSLKKKFISLQPTNLYGPRDNFDLKSAHVIPALIRKFHNAKVYNKKTVEVWGSGIAKREFMHVNDLADAVIFCLKNNIYEDYINIGTKDYISIKKLAILIKNIVNFNGKIIFNKKYPEGTKERKLDTTLIKKYRWLPKISLKTGLQSYYDYFKKLELRD
jgi:GDP-L-fucose synthase